MCQAALGLDMPGQAEVGDVRLAPLVKQDVCRLEVAVQDPPLVRMMNGLGDGGHQPGRGSDIGDEVAQALVQAAAAYQLHAEEALARPLAHLVNGHDVRVVELRDGFDLVLKPDPLGFAGEFGRLDHLESDQPVESDLPCLVDDAHPASAQLRHNLVAVGGRSSGTSRSGFTVTWHDLAAPAGPRRIDRQLVVHRTVARRFFGFQQSLFMIGVIGLSPGTENRIDDVVVAGKPLAIGVAIGHIALLEPQIQLERQQVTQELGTCRADEAEKERLQFGLAAAAPGRLESIACVVDPLELGDGQSVVERQPEMHPASSAHMARINCSFRSTVLAEISSDLAISSDVSPCSFWKAMTRRVASLSLAKSVSRWSASSAASSGVGSRLRNRARLAACVCSSWPSADSPRT